MLFVSLIIKKKKKHKTEVPIPVCVLRPSLFLPRHPQSSSFKNVYGSHKQDDGSHIHHTLYILYPVWGV